MRHPFMSRATRSLMRYSKFVKKLESNEALQAQFAEQFGFLSKDRRLVLVTGHRRESFGGGFERICQALVSIAKEFDDVEIVYPVHLNPNVREPVNRLLGGVKNIHLIEPLDYLPFVYLMNRSYLILTDSEACKKRRLPWANRYW